MNVWMAQNRPHYTFKTHRYNLYILNHTLYNGLYKSSKINGRWSCQLACNTLQKMLLSECVPYLWVLLGLSLLWFSTCNAGTEGMRREHLGTEQTGHFLLLMQSKMCQLGLISKEHFYLVTDTGRFMLSPGTLLMAQNLPLANIPLPALGCRQGFVDTSSFLHGPGWLRKFCRRCNTFSRSSSWAPPLGLL